MKGQWPGVQLGFVAVVKGGEGLVKGKAARVSLGASLGFQIRFGLGRQIGLKVSWV